MAGNKHNNGKRKKVYCISEMIYSMGPDQINSMQLIQSGIKHRKDSKPTKANRHSIFGIPPDFSSKDHDIPKMAKVISGIAISKEIRAELKEQIAEWVAKGNRAPHLTAVLIGDDPASHTYVNNKIKVTHWHIFPTDFPLSVASCCIFFFFRFK